MGEESHCERVVEETIKAFGGLDIIVSNAVSGVFLILFIWKGDDGE